MNKNEFLEELRSRLTALPKDEIEGYVSFYSEAIDDRVEDGKTESEAVRDLGGIDEVINEICKDKSLTSLVKQKVTPKRKITSLEIVLLILGFPLWFPLALTLLILVLVAYLLTWILVIVTYAVEIALIAGAIGSLVSYGAGLMAGTPNIGLLGIGLLGIGGAILFSIVCVLATKFTIKIAKGILLGIKRALIGGGK